MTEIEVILWDFDGVILESNTVREQGFRQVLANFDTQQVAALIAYHRMNGGLSRYVKFRYFYEEILGAAISDEQVQALANEFSLIMRQLLTKKENLISETVNFIKHNHLNFKMHIVSGSDQNELRFLCEELELTPYFESIHGSPTPKNTLVEELLTLHRYNPQKCVLIGDAINDYDAATKNEVYFCAYNNPALDYLTNFTVYFK